MNCVSFRNKLVAEIWVLMQSRYDGYVVSATLAKIMEISQIDPLNCKTPI